MAHFEFFKQLGFANDANFSTGTNIGDPTKVAPSSARIAEGFTPDQLPAEWLNWVLNYLGNKPAEVSLHRAMSEWSIRALIQDENVGELTNGAGGVDYTDERSIAVADKGGQAVCEHYVANATSETSQVPMLVTIGGQGDILISNDGNFQLPSNVITPVSPPSGASWIWCLGSYPSVGGVSGRIFVAQPGSSDIVYFNTPSAPTTVSTSLAGITAIHANASPLGRVFIGGWGASNQIAHSDNLGATWTNHTVAAWAANVAHSILTIASSTAGGNLTVIAAARQENTLAVSTDGGNSWSTVAPGVTVPAGSHGIYGIAWSEFHGKFICVGTDGYALSTNGTAWTVYSTVTGLTTLEMGMAARGRAVACIGPVTAILCRTLRDTLPCDGVFYTTDFLNWRFYAFGAVYSVAGQVTQLAPVGARLAAVGNGTLCLSGVVASAIPEATFAP